MRTVRFVSENQLPDGEHYFLNNRTPMLHILKDRRLRPADAYTAICLTELEEDQAPYTFRPNRELSSLKPGRS
jgi:hypothetical protein